MVVSAQGQKAGYPGKGGVAKLACQTNAGKQTIQQTQRQKQALAHNKSPRLLSLELDGIKDEPGVRPVAEAGLQTRMTVRSFAA